MASTVTNKTQKPISIPLPRGKVLHLGPKKSGQISSHDVDHPAVKALVETGAIEIVGEGRSSSPGQTGDGRTPAPTQGHATTGGPRRSGDR